MRRGERKRQGNMMRNVMIDGEGTDRQEKEKDRFP